MKNFVFSLLLLFSVVFIYDSNAQGKKPASNLNERVQQLTDLASKKVVLRFNANKFKDFVKAVPRNYSIVVMFTALAPQRQCMVCKQANDEFAVVANSFRYNMNMAHFNKLFFAMVDFDEGSEVFQMMKLNTAPVFVHFPAKGKPKAADTMDIQRVGFGAEAIARWINERTDIQIRIMRPANYSGTLSLVLLVLFVGVFLYIRRNNLEFLYNKTMWGVWALLFCFAMTSGQMWNHIRGPPFIHRNQQGQTAYIHGNSQGQFVVETYIIMALNAAVAVGIIFMTEAAKGKGESRKRKIQAVIGLVFITIFFSSILSIFRTKTHGYPYSFLFK
ncbi:tumor suppressor candidate 3 [Euwallacea fornicatus]|uniref:tumor suppressor candidate 3 n=1 Tax=Euwallacea fornicatus TaxID=995702 RepID=UPI0033903C76